MIVKVNGHGGFRKRIIEMGFVRGSKVKNRTTPRQSHRLTRFTSPKKPTTSFRRNEKMLFTRFQIPANKPATMPQRAGIREKTHFRAFTNHRKTVRITKNANFRLSPTRLCFAQ